MKGVCLGIISVVNVERFYRVCKPRDRRKTIFRDSNRMELCMGSGHKKYLAVAITVGKN